MAALLAKKGFRLHEVFCGKNYFEVRDIHFAKLGANNFRQGQTDVLLMSATWKRVGYSLHMKVIRLQRTMLIHIRLRIRLRSLKKLRLR